MAQSFGRVLIARIGWMRYYGRIDDKHDRLEGGGSWNRDNEGGELYNFKPIRKARRVTKSVERLFGYVQPGKFGRLALGRIDGSTDQEQSELPEVLVIFVATNWNAPPQAERQRVVGWYRNATVYKDRRDDPSGARNHFFCNLIADARNAVLLPTHLRQQVIPRSRPGAMGQANVWYPFERDGTSRNPRWFREALAYVESYSGPNLIKNPEREIAEVEKADLERVAGFESDPRIRIAVEEHAMRIVIRRYKNLRFKVEDKHKSQPYDLECTKAGRVRYVEVKGTRTLGHQILLTPNEVTLPDRKGAVVDLCIVHSIKVAAGRKIKCSGGKVIPFENWKPRDHDLRPVSFICELRQTK